MNLEPNIIILSGGTGPERSVSLASGKALAASLSTTYKTKLVDINKNALPSELNPLTDLIFPVIHGEFGEDGQLQSLMDSAGLEYCGSATQSSRLCINKITTKQCVSDVGVRVPKSFQFSDPAQCNAAELIDKLGENLVIKPVAQGSSVSLFLISGLSELEKQLDELSPGDWMVEARVYGREVTIGVLGNHPLGVVEVIPMGGLYDYERKYTSGATEYRFPAVLDQETENEIKSFATSSFEACGCRDFARIDFIICEDGNAHFLEINTLPGLTPTSLLPKSASSSGYNFDQLTRKLISPGLERFFNSSSRVNNHAA